MTRSLQHPVFLLTLGIACLLCTSVSLGQDPSSAWAKKMFDKTSHNFGNLVSGGHAECTFKIKNIFKEDIVILGDGNIAASCNCTSATIDKTRLKTGETATITAVIDAKNYAGRKDGVLTVKFAPPFTGTVLVYLYAFIDAAIQLTPGQIDFGTLGKNTAAAKSVKIHYAGGDPNWRITKMQSTSELVSAELRSLGKATNGDPLFQLEAKLQAGVPDGRLAERIVLTTTNSQGQMKQVSIPVDGLVVSGVTIAPKTLLLGSVPQGKVVERVIVVQSQQPFTITQVGSDSPGQIEVTADRVAAPVQKIRVRFTAPPSVGDYRAKVVFTTDKTGASHLTADITAQVVPAG